MKHVVVLIVGTFTLLAAFAKFEVSPVTGAVKTQPQVRVSIATGGPFGPSRDRFRAGEQVPVAITMTNTSSEAVYVCVTSPLYQDVPTLTRDGETVPYMSWQAYEQQLSEKSGTCGKESLPEPTLLQPGEPTLVDWFVLSDDASLVQDGWYDPLPPGHYELSIKRRLNCCDGPSAESNKVDFEID